MSPGQKQIFYKLFLLDLYIRKFTLIATVITGISAYSQSGGGVMSNGNYLGEFTVSDCFKKSTVLGKFKADTIKSNYVLKGEKIWRTINLESKQNQVFFNTGVECAEVGLFEVIKFGLFVKQLNAFSSDDFNDTKNHRLNQGQILKMISVNDTSKVDVFDANGDKTTETLINNRSLYGSDIKSYILKEDWIINSYNGKIEKYIIGIAPVVYDKKRGKTVPLFWLYYAEWKTLFASFPAKNFYTDANISYDDAFINKYFISVISKESNLFDRSVKSVNHGKDFLSEGEVINDKINTKQEDLYEK